MLLSEIKQAWNLQSVGWLNTDFQCPCICNFTSCCCCVSRRFGLSVPPWLLPPVSCYPAFTCAFSPCVPLRLHSMFKPSSLSLCVWSAPGQLLSLHMGPIPCAPGYSAWTMTMWKNQTEQGFHITQHLTIFHNMFCVYFIRLAHQVGNSKENSLNDSHIPSLQLTITDQSNYYYSCCNDLLMIKHNM